MSAPVTELWDTPGLPPRSRAERCSRHGACAYRDDDPARCPICHRSWQVIAEWDSQKEGRSNGVTPEGHLAIHSQTDAKRARGAAAKRGNRGRVMTGRPPDEERRPPEGAAPAPDLDDARRKPPSDTSLHDQRPDGPPPFWKADPFGHSGARRRALIAEQDRARRRAQRRHRRT